MPNKAFHMTHRCCSGGALKTLPVKLGPKKFSWNSTQKRLRPFIYYSFPLLLNIFKGYKCNMLRGCQAFFLSRWDGLKTILEHGETAEIADEGFFLHWGCRSLLPLPAWLVRVGWRLWMEAGKGLVFCLGIGMDGLWQFCGIGMLVLLIWTICNCRSWKGKTWL